MIKEISNLRGRVPRLRQKAVLHRVCDLVQRPIPDWALIFHTRVAITFSSAVDLQNDRESNVDLNTCDVEGFVILLCAIPLGFPFSLGRITRTRL
jgi:hypothetical protein